MRICNATSELHIPRDKFADTETSAWYQIV